ncbi:glycosyltransferase [Microcystis aeruginosa]|uniref:Putative glycosyl transferase n=1 Tax=Microcystis aeruginosa SPC777 TaxID=482300 RepID=S3JXA7_MICAE|nr:glycosyltransferase [Microcystis aeruginosa]EPF24462.1 putative glycosyl transferase [Microcystis aeruginosa SPC777]
MSQISEISYVIPTLNSAATLDMTLLSLRSQKDVEVNIIVVDSGSTDGTLDLLQKSYSAT